MVGDRRTPGCPPTIWTKTDRPPSSTGRHRPATGESRRSGPPFPGGDTDVERGRRSVRVRPLRDSADRDLVGEAVAGEELKGTMQRELLGVPRWDLAADDHLTLNVL